MRWRSFRWSHLSSRRRCTRGCLQDIAAKRLPARRPRSNARVVKRKMSNFKLKRAEHYRPPTPHGTFAEAVHVQPPPVLEFPRRQHAAPDGACLKLFQREPLLI